MSSHHHPFRQAALRIYHDIDDLDVAFTTYVPPLILLFVVSLVSICIPPSVVLNLSIFCFLPLRYHEY